MFKAVHLMKGQKSIRPVVAYSSGKVVVSNEEAGALIGEHFDTLFHCPNSDTQYLQAFERYPHPLQVSSTPWEVNRALKRLTNGRAAGSDDLSDEVIKYSVKEVAPVNSSLLNAIVEQYEPIDVSHGLLIPLRKPGKPKGPPKLKPIILLTALRKAISLTTLYRISSLVNGFLSHTQSGFRTGRSTLDIIWAHRWFSAKCDRHKVIMEVLGIDICKACDTFHRDRLLIILKYFLEEDHVRLERYLLACTYIATC